MLAVWPLLSFFRVRPHCRHHDGLLVEISYGMLFHKLLVLRLIFTYPSFSYSLRCIFALSQNDCWQSIIFIPPGSFHPNFFSLLEAYRIIVVSLKLFLTNEWCINLLSAFHQVIIIINVDTSMVKFSSYNLDIVIIQ